MPSVMCLILHIKNIYLLIRAGGRNEKSRAVGEYGESSITVNSFTKSMSPSELSYPKGYHVVQKPVMDSRLRIFITFRKDVCPQS